MNWPIVHWKNIAVLLAASTLLGIVVYVYYTTNGFGYMKKPVKKSNIQGFKNVSEPEFVMYHAEWCGHCKKAMPEFEKLVAKCPLVVNGQKVNARAVNEKDLSESEKKAKGLEGFPTFILTTADGQDITYSGGRNAKEFEDFINNNLGGAPLATPNIQDAKEAKA